MSDNSEAAVVVDDGRGPRIPPLEAGAPSFADFESPRRDLS